jgi:hypothetical protein
MKYKMIWIVLALIFVSCSSHNTATTPHLAATPAPVPPLPDHAILEATLLPYIRERAQKTGGIGQTFRNQQEVDALTLGRPAREGFLQFDKVIAYQPGQTILSMVHSNDRWIIPILVNNTVRGTVEVDQHGKLEGLGFGQWSQPLPAAYDDPTAEVWLVSLNDITRQVLLVRGSNETLIQPASGFYDDLNALVGRETSPDEMMPAIKAAINQHCRVMGVFWQC